MREKDLIDINNENNWWWINNNQLIFNQGCQTKEWKKQSHYFLDTLSINEFWQKK